MPTLSVKKDKAPTNASEFDKMIDFKWTHSVIQTSATVLCLSNYKEQLVNIAIIDLKTRRKNIVKTFKLSNRPTFLFQVDDNNLLIGTEEGKIEQWLIDNGVCDHIYDAHPESEAGISVIKYVQSQSPLLRGQEPADGKQFNLVVTASAGTSYFSIWKLFAENQKLQQFYKI